MFYSLFVLTLGVYLGQEYNIIPSIKLLGLGLLNNLQKIQLENEKENLETDTLYNTFLKYCGYKID
jgi:hypothetical protein